QHDPPRPWSSRIAETAARRGPPSSAPSMVGKAFVFERAVVHHVVLDLASLLWRATCAPYLTPLRATFAPRHTSLPATLAPLLTPSRAAYAPLLKPLRAGLRASSRSGRRSSSLCLSI